jgi:hypothetical protein
VTKRKELEPALAKAEAARKELEATLAEADAARKELEATLAEAEAALVDAVINSTKVDGDRAEANANLDKARVYCRLLHAALVELAGPVSIGFRCADLSCDLLFSPRTTCWSDCLEGRLAVPPQLESSSNCPFRISIPSPEQAIHRINISISAQEPSRRDALARSSIPRQTTDLLALILAYLLYFHIDVQLQILSLRSIFP